MAARKPLTDDEIADRLAGLPGWTRDGDGISRTFSDTWDSCIDLAVRVAAKANELDHHPDIDIRWRLIRFIITTHAAGQRLTELDFELARHIDAIAAAAQSGQ
jgi:4a-hydroxytetrahydrobiopterin dehydratase